MPASATITAFYSFTANTKARASQVNSNFNLFRGHLLPIDPTATAAATNTYDLGSTEWRWRTAYVRYLDFHSATTTGARLQVQGDVTATLGAWLFQVNSTTVARISNLGFYMGNADWNGTTNTGIIPASAIGNSITASQLSGQNYGASGYTTGTVNSTSYVTVCSVLLTIITNRPVFIFGVGTNLGIGYRTNADDGTESGTLKLDLGGTTIWEKQFGAAADTSLRLRAQDINGFSFVVAGSTTPSISVLLKKNNAGYGAITFDGVAIQAFQI